MDAPWNQPTAPDPIKYRGFWIELDDDGWLWTSEAEALADFESGGGPFGSANACYDAIDEWWSEQEAERICSACRGTGRIGSLQRFGGACCPSCGGTGETQLWQAIEPLSQRPETAKPIDILTELARVLTEATPLDPAAVQLEADISDKLRRGDLG